MVIVYRVTHQVVTNLPLTSKQKFRFGLAKATRLVSLAFASTVPRVVSLRIGAPKILVKFCPF